MEDLTMDTRIPARLCLRMLGEVDGCLETWVYNDQGAERTSSAIVSRAGLHEIRAWFAAPKPYPTTLAVFREFTLHAPDGFDTKGAVYRVTNREEFLEQCAHVLGPFTPPTPKDGHVHTGNDLLDFVQNAWDHPPGGMPTHLLLTNTPGGGVALLRLEEIAGLEALPAEPWWAADAREAAGVKAPPRPVEAFIRVVLKRSGFLVEAGAAQWKWIP